MFREIDASGIEENAVKLISKDWMLITAGDQSGYNTMTASWGMIGELWGKDAVACFIRPQRHTMSFIEENETFSLSFLKDSHRDILNFCGTHSGRDCDKAAETGLVPIFSDGTTYFEQAKLVIICKKMAVSEITPDSFLDSEIDEKFYPDKDYHKVFVARIEKVLVND